jgi:hypothetical protein
LAELVGPERPVHFRIRRGPSFVVVSFVITSRTVRRFFDFITFTRLHFGIEGRRWGGGSGEKKKNVKKK